MKSLNIGILSLILLLGVAYTQAPKNSAKICNSSHDCQDQGFNKICLPDGQGNKTCQHRCADPQNLLECFSQPLKRFGDDICDKPCNESEECEKSATCRLCISDGKEKTCQHRCLADLHKNEPECLAMKQIQNKIFGAKQCNEVCENSTECDKSSSCGLCIPSGEIKICQHRCLAEEFKNEPECLARNKDTMKSFATPVCGDSCQSHDQCKGANSCDLCIPNSNGEGICQHRCLLSNSVECLVFKAKQAIFRMY
ncbi:UNKNOWN [Stylonychia lemnae]|uniref:Uncharacterized protein n=1 Tax=Stylonychia lemnae TaxID=5949 RepID=A0A077ZTR8_STYLE|nr:UNKNOWN [Stylonychia lemnae]|eukprot:CDW71826.1 UNKNOWN [Stylonychia lemnae]